MTYMPDNPKYSVNTQSAFNLPFESKDLLSKVASDRIDHLTESLKDSNRLLLQRTELKNDFQQEISKDHMRIQNLLFDFENKGKDISSLELSLANLSQEERQQEVSHWRDTVELKRELRNTEKELRSAMLDLWMIQFLKQ